ncbi:MAG: OmpA family protein [Nitrospinota bacterium]|nr:OmpA family protein [Nitrospinota bacterium]
MTCSTRKRATLTIATMVITTMFCAAGLVCATGAEAKGKPQFMIKFEPGTTTIIHNERAIMKAAMYAVEKGYTLQIEGFSCLADADASAAPTFRLDLAGKRAEEVRTRIMKYGVPSNNVYSISYERGQCAAVITVLK